MIGAVVGAIVVVLLLLILLSLMLMRRRQGKPKEGEYSAVNTMLAVMTRANFLPNDINPGYFPQAATALKPQQIPMFLHFFARVWGCRWYPQTSEQ